MKIAEMWPVLEERHWSGGYALQGVNSEAAIDLFVGLRQPATRLFIFVADDEIAAKHRKLQSSTGLDIRAIDSTEFGPKKAATQVTLTDNRYADLFTILLQDICDRVGGCDSKREAYVTLTSRFSEWQRFLAKQAPDGLSEEQQRGLYGELKFLELLIGSGLIDRTGMGCWRGPHGADQDYQFPRMAVEVKVSMSAQNQEIVISSERQLDSRNYDRLFVFHLAVSVRQNNGETLNELVNGVKSSIPSRLKQDLEEALFTCGYLQEHEERYRTAGGYVVRESNFFDVKDDFPRITEDQVVNGVGKVRYAISVPVCKKFLVSKKLVLECIGAAYEG